MKSTRLPAVVPAAPIGFPGQDELAALRAWMEGVPTRAAVEQYLPGRLSARQSSSRSVIGSIRRQLAAFARSRGRHELADFFTCAPSERRKLAKGATGVIELLRRLPPAEPVVTDEVEKWLAGRVCRVLRTHGIKTLADLTVRVPRRRRWWIAIAGLGARSARTIEAFFAEHPALTERARALVVVKATDAAPWESIVVPADVDGTRGRFRGDRRTCSLEADDDYTAVQAWLQLHEAPATQRAYKKEAERLMLWSILQAGKALSSLTTEDAVAYRAFLRRPAPRDRWVGRARARSSPEWRPFQGPLSATSTAYALSVLNALFRWLLEKGYVLTNPFSGVKARGAQKAAGAVERVFSSEEWQRIRSVADGIENVPGWSPQAAQRLRFVLDFWFATGLRPQEMVDARLANVHRDDVGDDWLIVVGKGAKKGRVAIPTSALGALERHLVQRGLPTTRARWAPDTPLVGSVDGEPITRARIWAIVKRFFAHAAGEIEAESPKLAGKLRRASPHWMRHTHATHALRNGADLKTVQDNLRHASIATTTIYLHSDQARRARQMREAFAATRT